MLRVVRRAMSQYSHLTKEDLIKLLEARDQLPSPGSPNVSTHAGSSTLPENSVASSSKLKVKKTRQPTNKPQRAFHFASHPTRHVALLIAYHGWPYSGLAIQENESSSVVTVEGELLKALEKTHLIEKGKGWEGCKFSRCGRTDRGVSGEGQVVDLFLRSNRDAGVGWREATEPSGPKVSTTGTAEAGSDDDLDSSPGRKKGVLPPSKTQSVAVAKATTEFPYPRLINGSLPPSIRVLAWAPVDDNFDSRYSCTYRHYKYPFHIDPTPPTKLDLALMRKAAESLVGEHDFRNFCKLDGSKQIESHSRRVTEVWFDEDEVDGAGMVVFNLVGTAFLWHQVRHIIAILFLIGSKLEDTTLISELLDISKAPSKPHYGMGDPLPLTLHECGYNDALDWRYGGYDGVWQSLAPEEKDIVKDVALAGRDALEQELEMERQKAELRMYQVGGGLRTLRMILPDRLDRNIGSVTPLGAGEVLITGQYRKVMERPRGETPEVVNSKWRESKAQRKAAAAIAERNGGGKADSDE